MRARWQNLMFGAGVGLVQVLMLTAIGCGPQAYVSGYQFYPHPASVEVAHDVGNARQVPVTVLATILGVRSPARDGQREPSVAVRLQVQNHGSTPVTLDPGSLELVTGTLRPFPPPRTRPPATIEVEPHGLNDIAAWFPLPPGERLADLNMNYLRLRWRLQIGQQSIPLEAYFTRGNPEQPDQPDEAGYGSDVY